MDNQHKKSNIKQCNIGTLDKVNQYQCIIMDFHLLLTLLYTLIIHIGVYWIIFNSIIQTKYPHGFHLLTMTLSCVFVLLLVIYLITNLRENIEHILNFSFILNELITIVNVDYLAPCENICHFRLYILFLLLFIASFTITSSNDIVVNFFVCGIQFTLLGVFLFKRSLFNENNIVESINDWALAIITIGILFYCKYNFFNNGNKMKQEELSYKNNIDKLAYVAQIHNCSILSFDFPSLNSQMNDTMKRLYNKILDKKRQNKSNSSKIIEQFERKITIEIKDRFRTFIRKYYNNFIDEDKLISLCTSVLLLRYFKPLTDNITPMESCDKGDNNDDNKIENTLLNDTLKAIDVETCSKSPYKLGNYFIVVSPNIEGIASTESIIKGLQNREIDECNEDENDNDYDNDNILYYSIYIKIAKDKANDYLSIDLYFKDIREEQLVKTAKENMKLRTTHLAQIAHEFKTPLIIVSHVIKDLSCKVINESKYNTIYSMAEYSLSLITDLTDYSRKCNNYNIDFLFERVDVSSIVDFAFSILETLISCHDTKSGHIVPKKIVSKEIGMINTDGKRLKQVLVNLFNNSFKFTNSGTIVIKVEPTPFYLFDKTNARQRYYIENKRSITFTIEDTGIGIECGSNNKKLFKEYHIEDNMETKIRNQTGSGLGLSIVKKIVEKLGDEINYTSVYHQGTSFCFNIFDIDNEYEYEQQNNNNGLGYSMKKELEEFSSKHIPVINCHSKRSNTNLLFSHSNNNKIKKKRTNQILLLNNITKPHSRKSAYFKIQYPTKLFQNQSYFHSNELKKSLIPNTSILTSRRKSQMILDNKELAPSPFCFNDSDQSESWLNRDEEEELNSSVSTISQKNLCLTTSNMCFPFNIICAESSFSLYGVLDFPLSFQTSNNKIINFLSISESTKSDLIIIVEDNRVIRKCLTNTIQQSVTCNNLNFHIIGLCDGYELVYAIYYDQLIGKRIKFVFSDENMTLLNGIESYRILQSNCKIDLTYLHFFVISSYNPHDLYDINIHKLQILNKPVRREIFEKIFENYRDTCY